MIYEVLLKFISKLVQQRRCDKAFLTAKPLHVTLLHIYSLSLLIYSRTK